MAGSLNKATLIGNLGKDPEARSTQNGGRIVNLTVATSETWGKGADRQEKTEWHRIVVFNEHIANFLEQYAQKGTKVYVEGKITTRKWTDQSGQEKYSTEIVVDKFKGDVLILGGGEGGGSSASGGSRASSGGASQRREARPAAPEPDLDDEIPF